MVTGSTLGQITTTQSYDSFGQAAGIVTKHGGIVLYEERYTRDKVGNLINKSVTVGGQVSTYGYRYDANNQLTSVTKDGAVTGHFEYDANGNRTLANGIGATFDDQDRLTSLGGTPYSYTGNGELRRVGSGATTSYMYDVFGNLKHVDLAGGGTIDYLIDGRKRRIGKKVNGVLVQGFLYQDQLKPAAELDGQGNVVSRFVYAGSPNVPEYMIKGGVTYRIITDQVGSVRLVVNSATGAIVQRIDYDEWGNVQSDSQPGFQPFGFAGGLYDRDTGLVRFGARDYDAATGRWLQSDPIGLNGGRNMYSYTLGNPINLIDPTGLVPDLLVTNQMISDTQAIIKNVSNNTFTDKDLASLTEKVIKVISISQGLAFQGTENKVPLKLSEKQDKILENLISKLKEKYPSDSDIVKFENQFKLAKEDGRCIVK